MKFTHFFIDRPRFASVISCLIVIFGAISYFSLPVSQYPEIAPPQVQVTAVYPGANPETIADTVATPLEQEINGVEGMLYMSSQASSDGVMSLVITFEPGTDLDLAQVLVQNRVSAAEPRLPEPVRRRGVTTIKSSPDLLMGVNLYSPNDTYDQAFMSNYAVLNINDRIKRLDGIGNSRIFGGSEYAMRVWLNPDKMASLNLTAGDIVAALRAQNVQVAGGTLNRAPTENQHAFELGIETQGRLVDVKEFENIIVKSGERGQLVHLNDVARVELGTDSYTTLGYMGTKPSVIVATFLRPGANALNTADLVTDTMAELAKEFPPDLEYKIIYNPTKYVAESIQEVLKTLMITVSLVVLVVITFLQSWRTAIIPVIAIPISLIGTFGLMLLFGYSLNMLSLFGLVLAIGIVVDDAIVVVENVERKLSEGHDIVTATKETMNEVGTALIATSLVLVAVFLPTVLMEGISGQFYKQFGVTIASATMISTLVTLTLSPAMAAIFMAKLGQPKKAGLLTKPGQMFNRAMNGLSYRYGLLVSKLVRLTLIMSVIYVGLVSLAWMEFSQLPTGFIPPQDHGYALTIINLPPGSSMERTNSVVNETAKRILAVDGVSDTMGFSGYSAATNSTASNAAAIFSILDPMDQRRDVDSIVSEISASTMSINGAFIITVPPPPVSGMGHAGGFKMMVQDRLGRGPTELEKVVWMLAGSANQLSEVTGAYSLFETNTPRIYLDIDRERARRLNIPLDNIYETLQVYLGSTYVNDFNFLGRSFRITGQADAQFRKTPDDILRLRVRSNDGHMIPLGSVATAKDIAGPSRIPHYNLFPAAALSGSTVQGFSSGQAIAAMEKLADKILPDGYSYEWTELALQEKKTGNTVIYIFALAVLFVFLMLSAQYESWTLPLAIILIVPMCVLSASLGLIITGMDNNILTQIGLIVLVGLASKNAILIVEFAKQNEDLHSMDRWKAAASAAKTRLRPILMTALSFILGVVPLLVATGAGFEMRRAIGLTVFSGMVGVTVFGLIFTPVFYVICRKLALFGRNKTATQEMSSV